MSENSNQIELQTLDSNDITTKLDKIYCKRAFLLKLHVQCYEDFKKEWLLADSLMWITTAEGYHDS